MKNSINISTLLRGAYLPPDPKEVTFLENESIELETAEKAKKLFGIRHNLSLQTQNKVNIDKKAEILKVLHDLKIRILKNEDVEDFKKAELERENNAIITKQSRAVTRKKGSVWATIIVGVLLNVLFYYVPSLRPGAVWIIADALLCGALYVIVSEMKGYKDFEKASWSNQSISKDVSHSHARIDMGLLKNMVDIKEKLEGASFSIDSLLKPQTKSIVHILRVWYKRHVFYLSVWEKN